MVESALNRAKIFGDHDFFEFQIAIPSSASKSACNTSRRRLPLVIGCVVNGPGEARDTDIGFTGGGNGTHQVYISGLTDHRQKDADIVDHLVELAENKAAEIEAARGQEKEVGLAAAQ